MPRLHPGYGALAVVLTVAAFWGISIGGLIILLLLLLGVVP